MKRKASEENGIVATDTFVFLCVTKVKATIGRQCRQPVKISYTA